jgi:hypothetical protein
MTTDGPSGVTPNSIKITNSASPGSVVSGSYVLLHQYVEGVNLSNLGFGTAGARAIILSFYVKSSVTGTYSAAIRNNAVNRSYVGTYTINAANTWERKSIAFVGDTSGTWLIDTGIGARVTWALTAGSTYETATPNTWLGVSALATSGSVDLVTTASATWQVTGVQLEAGPVATPFEFEPFETTLRKCQRYFYRHAPTGITYMSFAYAGAQQRLVLPLPCPMRATANVSASGWAGGTTPTTSAINSMLSTINFYHASGAYYIDTGTIIDVNAEL